MYTTNTKINKQLSNWLIFMFISITIMIIVGGLTRLTDSGLSITQWEFFKGFVPPLSQSDWVRYFNLYKEIPEYRLQNYNMTMQEFKIIFWWEWAHRFLGRLIGVSFLIPMIYFSFKIKISKLLNIYLIFILICIQGFIGWYMVSSGLHNRIDVSHFRLSVHLLMAFLILSLIFWNFLKTKEIKIFYNKFNSTMPLIFIILVFLQIGIGAFVSGMDAGKIYNTWPLMGKTYFPDDNNFVNLFNLAAFSDPSIVQFIHRNLAYIIGIFYLFMFYKIYKEKIYELYKSINYLGFFMLLQILLGILTLLNGAQIYLAAMHQLSSVFLISSCIYLFYINK